MSLVSLILLMRSVTRPYRCIILIKAGNGDGQPETGSTSSSDGNDISISRSRKVTGRPVPDEMTRSRKKTDQNVSNRSRSAALCSCSSWLFEVALLGVCILLASASLFKDLGLGPSRPSYLKPWSVCIPRSCAIRMAMPRYIHNPLSRLAPNSSYANNKAACTTATLGQGKASGMADLARWAKACPYSGACTLVVSPSLGFW